MIRAFQWDLARQVERLDWLLAQLPRYAEWGYQELYLHLEDAVEYPSLPYVARPDAYRHADLLRLVEAADRVGIGVVPIVNLLGHTQYLVKTPELRDLNERRGPQGEPLEHGQICPLHPRTLEVAEKLIHDTTPFCTAGKLHVGLDESFHLGRHPLSRAEIARIGLAGHFVHHVTRLHRLVTSRGLRLGLWADMLAFIPEAIPPLPRDVVAYDWYYHAFERHPRVELFNFRPVDLATPLRAHGIEYWGCPMNGAFRYEPLPVFGERLANIVSWWHHARRHQAGGLLITSWEAYRLALEMTTVVDAAAASLWLDGDTEDHGTLLARGFRRVFGLGRAAARDAARAALACDARAFAGYARWEINDHWDRFAHAGDTARFRADVRFFSRLQRRTLPAPFAASVAFNRYLARRDVFVRENARAVFRLRRETTTRPERVGPHVAALLEEAAAFRAEISAGRRAARAMWARTRDAKVRGQNEALLQADLARLQAWLRWLRRVARRPSAALGASPLAGRWQLQLTVHNIAPAVQRVVVQQQGEDGAWRDLAGRTTIEFRTAAARPRAPIKREWSVPLEDPTRPLRLAVRGVGEVAISHVQVTDGITERRNRAWLWAQRRRLGRAAPQAGFPELDWAANLDEVELGF